MFIFRRKYYTLREQLRTNWSSCPDETNQNSVQHVNVRNEESVLASTIYFPNATQLTLLNGFSTKRSSVVTILDRIIPLKQLTKLSIECHHFSFDKMIDLLYSTPNLHSLTFVSMPFYKCDSTSIEKSEIFRLVSSTNHIRDMTFTEKCTLEKLKVLLMLCRRIQNLTISTLLNDFEVITRYLLDGSNPNTRHLSLLCFSRSSIGCFEKIDALIKSERLLEDYTLKSVGSKLYLWW